MIFGISGDLAKVMTFHSLYRLEQRGLLNCPIIGVAVDEWTQDDLRSHARAAIASSDEQIDEGVFDRLLGRMSYLSGDFDDAATYERSPGGRRCQVSGVLSRDTAVFVRPGNQGFDRCGGHEEPARVVVEKPFGHDLESARELAADIHQYIDESQLYRIDHFLGKDGPRRVPVPPLRELQS